MSDKPPKVAGHRYLTEHDRDLYETELAEAKRSEMKEAARRLEYAPRQRAHDAAVEVVKRLVPGADAFAFAVAHHVVEAALEGYDPELDDPNGWLGADERERDAKGEQ